MKASINEIQDSIIEEFSIFTEWMDKYEYLIELAKSLTPYEAKYKIDKFLISGCQSRVWVYAQREGETIKYVADSDALIPKGLIALLTRVLSGQKPEDILKADLYFIDRIGLKDNMLPTRANGLLAMIKQMKLYAVAF